MTRQWRESSLVRNGLTAGYLLIVVISWGTNYPLMKLALQDVPPLTFSVVRLFGGATVIACMLLMSGDRTLFPPRGERLRMATVGILQFASVLGFAGISLLFLPAGRTVTAIYTMPLWAAAFDVLILRARLTWLQYLGIAVSIGGMMLFLDPDVIQWEAPGAALGIALTLLAAACWGFGAVLYRTRSWKASMLCQTLWQLLSAGVILLAAAAYWEFPVSPRYTASLGLILLWNWLVPTAVAVWAWSKILSRMPASIAGQFLMCTPFVGIAFSAWVFNEDLPPAFAASAALITLGGVLSLIRRRMVPRNVPAQPQATD